MENKETATAIQPRKRKSARPGNGRAKPKNGSAPALPVTQPPSLAPPSSSESGLKFQLATLLRLSDNLVAKAVNAYDRLFQLGPKDQADVHLQMAREASARGKWEQALDALKKASQLVPDNHEMLLEMGSIHLRRQAPGAAVEVLARVKESGRSSHRLHSCLADALMMQEKYAEATVELERALRLKPDVAEDYYRLGVGYDRLGQYERAVAALRKAIELSPHEVAYQQSLGFTYESMGRRKEAIKCFKRALELERPSAAPRLRASEG